MNDFEGHLRSSELPMFDIVFLTLIRVPAFIHASVDDMFDYNVASP